MAENTWTADRRLYLDAKGNVVEADDPTRATLLVGQGGTIDLEQARTLGLLNPPAERKPGPDDPEGAFAYLEGETKGEGAPADSGGETLLEELGEAEDTKGKPKASANKLRQPLSEDK